MEFEDKATIAFLVIFLFCLIIVADKTISGMQVAPDAGDSGRGQPSCVDSDGGMNPDVSGIADRSPDYCLDENILMEQTCQGPQRYTCPHGCRNGACIPPLRLVKKEQPELNKQLIKIAQDERRQREQEQREAEQIRQRCTDECSRAANICNTLCSVPLFYPICTRDCNTVKQRCSSRC